MSYKGPARIVGKEGFLQKYVLTSRVAVRVRRVSMSVCIHQYLNGFFMTFHPALQEFIYLIHHRLTLKTRQKLETKNGVVAIEIRERMIENDRR